jgi:membrane protein implicated in regulation of membrane protease activity
MADQSLVGMLGSVVRAVRGGKMPGEVRVVQAGMPILLMAYSDEELPVATRVRVVHSRGSRQVDVEPWPRSRLYLQEG